MNQIKSLAWPSDAICLSPSTIDVDYIARSLYMRTCRHLFDYPGFCLLNVGKELDSIAFRKLMVELKNGMAAIHQAETSNTLHYISVARFDQQTSTKPHLDGGPDECFLMLGYEPSEVHSELEISDYSKCAFDLGLTPKEFMAKHNPMFGSGFEMLRPYSTVVPCFSASNYQIICINNSSASYSEETSAWQGTLHTASIPEPDKSKRRVINSTMIASVPNTQLELVSAADQQEFVSTTVVRRRGYDKTECDDIQ